MDFKKISIISLIVIATLFVISTLTYESSEVAAFFSKFLAWALVSSVILTCHSLFLEQDPNKDLKKGLIKITVYNNPVGYFNSTGSANQWLKRRAAKFTNDTFKSLRAVRYVWYYPPLMIIGLPLFFKIPKKIYYQWSIKDEKLVPIGYDYYFRDYGSEIQSANENNLGRLLKEIDHIAAINYDGKYLVCHNPESYEYLGFYGALEDREMIEVTTANNLGTLLKQMTANEPEQSKSASRQA